MSCKSWRESIVARSLPRLSSPPVSHGPAILVLQHIACEPPGAYADVMRERDAELHAVELDEGEPLPDWREFDAMVVMGGPMGACDDADHPWLAAERDCIGAAVRAGLPFFGACLGSQLLAASLGARVYTGDDPRGGRAGRGTDGGGPGGPRARRTAAKLPDAPVAQRQLRSARGSGGAGQLTRVREPGLPRGPDRLRGPVPRRGHERDGGRVGGGAGLRASARAGARPRRSRRAAGGVRGASRGDDGARTLFSRWLELV